MADTEEGQTRHHHRVTSAQAGTRLDRFLAGRHRGLGRRGAAALIAEGRVRLERDAPDPDEPPPRTRKGERLRAGDVVWVDAPPERLAQTPGETPPAPASVPGVEIRHVDAQLVVLAKPAGVPTHPLRPGETGTVANHLALVHPECVAAGGPPREGGLAHRLDTLTSGLIVAARTPEAHRWLRARFDAHEVQKTYLALVHGAPEPAFTLEAPIASRRGRRRVDVGRGLPAVTRIEVREQYRDAALVSARTAHGRRHQIRAHLAHAGHPLVADALYGGRPLAEEPLAEEPLAEEPLAEEPLAEEPLAEEPLAEEPLAEELGALAEPQPSPLPRGGPLPLPPPLPTPLPLPLLHAAVLELPHPAPPHERVTHREELPEALLHELAHLPRR
jgi:23S rRNA pseudouridine1911/1915/1917 synthase